MREEAKGDGGAETSPSPLRRECEKLFEKYFGRVWDEFSKEQVLAAIRIRNDGALLFREIERVVVGAHALKRMLDGVPPPEEDPPPVFPSARKHDERYLLVWAFEEALVPFAPDPVSPRALAVVSLLMGYEHDSDENGAIKSAAERMKKTRGRYRRDRAPTTPETMQLVAQARALRELEAPARQALDALTQMFTGMVRQSESVPVGTVSHS